MPFASPADLSPIPRSEAPRDCPLCPRLARFRGENTSRASELVERSSAERCRRSGRLARNRRPRPWHERRQSHRASVHWRLFGRAFFSTLIKFGLARGEYRGEPGDGVSLVGTIVLNAVKCLPPANKPTPQEIATCGHYLEAATANLPNVRVVVAWAESPIQRRRESLISGRQLNSGTAPKLSPRTGEFCCRAIIARVRTRIVDD